MHKIFNGDYPSYMSEHFVKVLNVYSHNTRGSGENFVVPSVSGVASEGVEKTLLCLLSVV